MNKFTLILLLAATMAYSQDIELLEKQFATTPWDSSKLKLGLSISDYYLGLDRNKSNSISFELLDHLDAAKSPLLEVIVMHNAADLYWEEGYYSTSIALLRKTLVIEKSQGFTFWNGKSHHYIGLSYYYTADYDSALFHYQLAKKEYLAAGDTAFASRVENHIGLVYDQMGEYLQAINQIILSMKMQEKTPGYYSGAYKVSLAHELMDSAFFRSRIDKNMSDFEFEKKQGNKFKMAQTLRNIGLDYMNLGQYRQALTFFRNSNTWYPQANFEPFLEDFGAAYEAMNMLDSASYYYLLSLDKIAKTGTRHALVQAYARMGNVLLKQNQFEKALSYYIKTLDLEKQMGNRYHMVNAMFKVAEALEKKGHYQEALNYIIPATDLAVQIRTLEQQVTGYQAQQRIYQHEQDYKRSLEAQLKANALKKKLTDGQAQMNVARLSYLYESERKDRQLLQLRETALEQETILRTREGMILAAGGIVLLVSGVGFLFYSRFRQKKKLAEILENQKEWVQKQNAELTVKNTEKEILLSEVHHRVKNNLQIISSLINLNLSQADDKTSDALQQLRGRIYSMGLIHEKLYQREVIQGLRLDLYLKELTQYLMQSFMIRNSLSLEMDCSEIEIDVDRTMACGLICNELITNALKHAFTETQPSKKIKQLLQFADNRVHWTISDNGEKNTTHSTSRNGSFGLRFVDQLVTAKLGGSWRMSTEHGSLVSIEFPIHKDG